MQRDWKDIEFTAVAAVSDLRVGFKVYDIMGYGEGATKGVFDVPSWHRAGSNEWPDTVDSLEEAEPYLTGEVRWDGCSNWHFDEQDRLALHACNRDGLTRLGEVMARCWDWAAELLGDKWQGGNNG